MTLQKYYSESDSDGVGIETIYFYLINEIITNLFVKHSQVYSSWYHMIVAHCALIMENDEKTGIGTGNRTIMHRSIFTKKKFEQIPMVSRVILPKLTYTVYSLTDPV